jgi:hypothetical protein
VWTSLALRRLTLDIEEIDSHDQWVIPAALATFPAAVTERASDSDVRMSGSVRWVVTVLCSGDGVMRAVIVLYEQLWRWWVGGERWW